MLFRRIKLEETTQSRAGKIIKIVLTVSLFLVIGALIFRMCQASHKELEDTAITPAFKAAYSTGNPVRTHAVNDEFSENGSVYAYSLVYVEEAGYLQFTVRYNVRHINEVQATYKDLKEEDIRYELIDAKGNTYQPTVIERAEKYNYRYFKMEFTDVDFSTDTLSIRMVLGDIDINVGDKSTLVIHRKSDTSIPYEFTAQEKKELGK